LSRVRRRCKSWRPPSKSTVAILCHGQSGERIRKRKPNLVLDYSNFICKVNNRNGGLGRFETVALYGKGRVLHAPRDTEQTMKRSSVVLRRPDLLAVAAAAERGRSSVGCLQCPQRSPLRTPRPNPMPIDTAQRLSPASMRSLRRDHASKHALKSIRCVALSTNMDQATLRSGDETPQIEPAVSTLGQAYLDVWGRR